MLVGRDVEIAQLWAWLADNFSPIKILSGVGGVGKTSIAYTFAERLIDQAPPYIDKVLWLGAKSETFLPLKAQLTATRVDFQNVDELLLVTLWETGCPANQVPEQPSRDQLMNLAQEHLSEHNYLLVIDNVDTLGDDEQQQLLHLLTQLCSVAKAKAILTARRNLGAPQSMVVKIEGLSFDDFQVLVEEKSRLLEMSSPVKNAADMRQFYQASGGSPLFAASILRLVWLGDSFLEALRNWQGHDGETVRAAAFQREIGRLNMDAAKVLLSLCYLDRTSALELSSVLSLTRLQVQAALESLQQFSMTTIDSVLPGGAVFKLPSTLTLVAPLVEKRVLEWGKIKTACRKLRSVSSNKYPLIGDAIRRTLVQLNAGDHRGALGTVKAALQKAPDDPDLLCLLGRVCVKSGDFARAEESYQRAFDLGCKHRALVDGWLEVRESDEDWRGVIVVCEIGERTFNLCRYLISKTRAMMMIGDQYSRVGKHSQAEGEYESAITMIKEGLERYQYPADRASLWKLNESLVVRWLGSIRMTSDDLDGKRRFFGACHKAIMTYRLVSGEVVRSALDALNTWAQIQSKRSDVSEKVRGDAKTAEGRLRQLQHFVLSRQGFSGAIKNEIRAESGTIACLLDVILLQKNHRTA
jgi:tetratricopeptide (TPR) repeat protein